MSKLSNFIPASLSTLAEEARIDLLNQYAAPFSESPNNGTKTLGDLLAAKAKRQQNLIA